MTHILFDLFFSDEGDKLDDTLNEDSPATPAAGDNQSETTTAQYLPFPSSCDLNTRFRRLISAYQKYNKKRQEAEAAAAERVSHSSYHHY